MCQWCRWSLWFGIFLHPVSTRTTDDEYDINVKELLEWRIWGSQLTGIWILIHSDNDSAILAIDNRHSKSHLLQHCLRVICFFCASYDLDVQAEHLPGNCNVIADLLSRWFLDPSAASRFFALPDAD